MSYVDFDAPTITLLTDDQSSFPQNSVKLKFKADDKTKLYCELYVANKNDSWYMLKDYGDNLLANTEYTFELTDLSTGAYNWKISCSDTQSNTAVSSVRSFMVSDGSVAQAINNAENTNNDINTALDNIYSLSGSEAEIADILGVKESLKTILDKSSNLDRDIYNLAYRRDLDEKGRQDAQTQLIQNIENMTAQTPVNIKVTDVKNFVKYIKEEDLQKLLETYKSIKNLNINNKLFLESIKRTQSKAVISTKAMAAILYYADGSTKDITMIIKDISVANSDDAALLNSHGVTFVELVPKDIVQTARFLNIMTAEYDIIQEDPLIEFPSSTKQIIYYINETIDLNKIQNIDTVIIDKNIDISQSATGFSILGINSITDVSIDGKGVLIIIVITLILIYLIISLELIDKIKRLFSGVKKKVSYITVLLNDADDHLKIADYDKAALIYHEIKLTYEASNESVQKQVYDACYDFCNKLDIFYFNELFVEAEDMIINNQNAIETYDKMVMTYNKIDDKYKKDVEQKLMTMKRKVLH
jgi:flagellar biosynthesis/type III secretory pathway chaperone